MKKIVIVTLNTAIDHIIRIDRFQYGEVLRALDSSIWASGKGINTARAISTMDDANVVVLAFAGNNFLTLFDEIDKKNIHLKHILASENSRDNITISDRDGNLVTHLQTQGFSLDSQADLPRMQRLIEETVVEGDIAIVSGSLPPGIDGDSYRVIIERLKEIGAFVILDSSDENLIEGIKSSPDLIKPNFEEFKSLIENNDLKEENHLEIVSELRKLSKLNVGLIALTLGEHGALIFDRKSNKLLYANLEITEPYRNVNALGCGDSFVGGFAYGLACDKNFEDTIRIAVSLAAANLFSNGPGRVDPSKFSTFLNRVELTEVE